jgi:hypothetical protein
MCISKFPAAIAKFRGPRKETGFVHSLARRADTNLVISGCDNGEIGSERVHAQIVTPPQLDLLDRGREGLNSRRCRRAIRENQLAIGSHEKRSAIGEVLAPGQWALLGNVVSYRLDEGSYGCFDFSGSRVRQGFRVAWHGEVGSATRQYEGDSEESIMQFEHERSF